MISKSLADTAAIAREFTAGLEPNRSRATLVCLSGNLGAGKTTFTKSLAATLGVNPDDVTSPTFVIEKRFPIRDARWKTLVHIDAYRLGEAGDAERDLDRLRWAETVADPSNLIVIEWPENVGSAIPADAVRVDLSHVKGGAEGERDISIGGV